MSAAWARRWTPHDELDPRFYFDLCRELLGAAWSWCEQQDMQLRLQAGEDCQPALVEFLRTVKEDRLASTYEGGSPPNFILQCSRRRVPRGVGVPMVGTSERQVKRERFMDSRGGRKR